VWNHTGGNDSSWGIQFTVVGSNVELTGFTFNHRGGVSATNFSGTVELIDLTKNAIEFQASYGPNDRRTSIPFSGLSISLTSGDQYALVATSNFRNHTYDEVYATVVPAGQSPFNLAANSDIRITNGIFSNNNTQFTRTHYWGAFSNITTQSLQGPIRQLVIPEPTAALSFTIGLLGVGLFAARRKLR
jgi:hypothetical protein